MICEHDRVMILGTLPGVSIAPYAVGTVIAVHKGGLGLTVEFVDRSTGVPADLITARADHFAPVPDFHFSAQSGSVGGGQSRSQTGDVGQVRVEWTYAT